MKNTAPLAESSIGNWSLANVCSGGWVGCWGEGVGLWRPGEPFRSRLCSQGGPRRRCALGRSARLGSAHLQRLQLQQRFPAPPPCSGESEGRWRVVRGGVLSPVKEAPSSPELDYPRRAGSAVAGGPVLCAPGLEVPSQLRTDSAKWPAAVRLIIARELQKLELVRAQFAALT